LHLAVSAISRHILIFEEDAGTQLFERHSRGMVLTAASQVYLRYAQGVLAEGDNTQLEIDALKGMRRGHIRICSIEGIIAGPLSDAIASFRKKFPHITFNVQTADTQTAMQSVRDGDADIGIAFQSSPIVGIEISLRIPDPLHLICIRSHPLAKGKSVSLRQIAQYPVAMPDRTFGIRQLVDAASHVHQLHIAIALETNSVEALRAFARLGSGVTILPSLVAKNELKSRKVIAVPIDDAMLSVSSVDICVREGRVLPTVVSQFLNDIGSGDDFRPQGASPTE
jgi:DNA-binding transcriptional LysR family regulator